MIKIIPPYLTVMISCLSLPVLADGNVVVHFPDRRTVALSHVAHLEQLLSQPLIMASATGASDGVLAEKHATERAERQYQQVMERLRFWAEHGTTDHIATLRSILEQLADVRVTGRQFVNLDLDWVRLRPEANRRLDGDYTLYLRRHDMTVNVLGAVSGAGKQAWRPQCSVAGYLDGHERLAGADLNVVVIIFPDGRVRIAPVAYWDRRYMEVEPGSTLWVGVDPRSRILPDQHMEEEIISLLKTRIPDE